MVQLTRKLSGCLALHNLIWNDRVWHQGFLTLPATGPMCGNNLHCQIAPRLPLAEEARMSPLQTLAPSQTRIVGCNTPVQESYHAVITFCSSLADGGCRTEEWRRCIWTRAGDAKITYTKRCYNGVNKIDSLLFNCTNCSWMHIPFSLCFGDNLSYRCPISGCTG